MTAVLLLLVMLVGAGCAGTSESPQVASAGGGSGSADDPADTGAGGSAGGSAGAAGPDEDDLREFAACMRSNGVDLPDPEPGRPVHVGDPSADPKVVQEAMAACRELMPNGGAPPEMSPEDMEKARAMSACLRENGVDVPDPDPNSGGVQIRIGEGGAPDFEAMEKAMQKCRHLGPQLGSGGAPGGEG